MWDLKAQIAAGQFDLMAGANWQRAGDPKAPKPEPLPRPGVKSGTKTVSPKPLPIDQLQRRLNVNIRPSPSVPVAARPGSLPAETVAKILATTGKTQRQLAAELGVSQSTISRIRRSGQLQSRP